MSSSENVKDVIGYTSLKLWSVMEARDRNVGLNSIEMIFDVTGL